MMRSPSSVSVVGGENTWREGEFMILVLGGSAGGSADVVTSCSANSTCFLTELEEVLDVEEEEVAVTEVEDDATADEEELPWALPNKKYV